MKSIDDLIQAVTYRFGPDAELQQEIARELRAHLEDAVEAARRRGADERECVEEALGHFGDPDEIAEGIVQAHIHSSSYSRSIIMRGLKLCLWVLGVFSIIGGVVLSLPLHWLNCALNIISRPPLSEAGMLGHMFAHLAQGAGIASLGVGAFYIALARHPNRYGAMVPMAGLAAVLFGIVVGISGLSQGLPAFWYVKDSLIGLVFGSLIVLLWLRLRARGVLSPRPEMAD
jgi:hypothetical protein